MVIFSLKECLASRNIGMVKFMVFTQHRYLPWTGTMRCLLPKLDRQTLEPVVGAAEEHCQKKLLYQQLVQQADTVLNAYSDKMEDVERSLTRDRSMLVGLLADREVYEGAASLTKNWFVKLSIYSVPERGQNLALLRGGDIEQNPGPSR